MQWCFLQSLVSRSWCQLVIFSYGSSHCTWPKYVSKFGWREKCLLTLSMPCGYLLQKFLLPSLENFLCCGWDLFVGLQDRFVWNPKPSQILLMGIFIFKKLKSFSLLRQQAHRSLQGQMLILLTTWTQERNKCQQIKFPTGSKYALQTPN